MNFFSSLLAKLHAEFNDLRNKAHPPAVSDKLHELVDELVTRFHALEARVESLHQAQPAATAASTTQPAPATTTITAPIAPAPTASTDPAPAAPDTPASHASPGIIAILGDDPVSATPAATPDNAAQDPATAGAPGGYTGHDLTPGHPRINVERAGDFAEYHFTGPGTVYYQICSGCDSGMRVTSYIADSAGGVVSDGTETRVIMNKQSFTVTASGPCTFFVKPEQTGPISVGME